LKEESLQSYNNIQQQHTRNTRHTRHCHLQINGRPKSAMEACKIAKAEEEEDIILTGESDNSGIGVTGIGSGNSGNVCSYAAILLDERYSAFLNLQDQPTAVKLSCLDTRCDYCSLDGSVCDRFTYGAILEEIPRTTTKAQQIVQVGCFETNQYI